MSLHKYRIDFSELTANEKSDLVDRIESISFNGLSWHSGFKIADFFVNETINLDFLNIPEVCHLTRIYQ